MILVQTIFAFAGALAILIIVHELGHFTVARMCGVKVLRFSVGFGRTIFMRRLGADGTEWALAAVPIGGFVKMLDEREGEVAQHELHRTFNRQTVWRRSAIVAAGPAANFLLAVVLYWFLFISGVSALRPILDAPEHASPAAAAGLSRGDTVRKINDEEVSTWQDVRWKILNLAVAGASVRVEIVNSRNEISWHVIDLAHFRIEDGKADPLASIGLRLFRPEFPPVIGKVIEGQQAERSGLLPGDRVMRINGRAILTWDQVVSSVRASADKALEMDIDRAGRLMRVLVVPEASELRDGLGTRVGKIGAAPAMPEQTTSALSIMVRYEPGIAFQMALSRTWETAWFSLRMIGKMLVGEVSWRNLSGPVTIADYAGQSAQMGMAPYLAFLALISVSLGALNLLPIPILDGGHLMYYAIEIVKGGPVSERAMEMGQKVGLALLLVLMAFALFNDINRLVFT